MKLELQELNKSFGAKPVLSNVSLVAHTGYCIGVIGKNGAGKSTLFNLLINSILPDSGNILIDEQIMGNNFPLSLKRRIGAIVNQGYLVEDFEPIEYLDFIATIYGLNDSRAHAESLLGYLLEDYNSLKGQRIIDFSTGMKQKVAIASCLLNKPELLILDEPFNGLDVFSVDRVVTLLKNYSHRTITFISSHNLAHLEKIATHLLILDEAKIKYWGTKDDLIKNKNIILNDTLLNLIQSNALPISELNWLIDNS